MEKADRRCLFFLSAVTMAVVVFYFVLQGNHIFASKVDWIAQHSVFPDYFRKLFYQTGEIYPDFAIQIGGGQNIFNFGYYGLLNPCILLSYFFPFIEMEYWIMGISLVSLVSSVCLFYVWLLNKNLKRQTRVCASLIFMLAGPMIYHSYIQIIFVNYMPFLLLSLIATDRYFEKGKRGLLPVSVFLMVLTSFYFSVGGMVGLCIYALYCYLQKNFSYSVKGVFVAAIKYVALLLVGILMSCFYLIPSLVSLFSGRSMNSHVAAPALLTLFSPFSNMERFLYAPYGLGLSIMALVVLFAGLFQKNVPRRIFSLFLLIVTTFPLFTYLLNGGLYNNTKVLIPFLPLMCVQIGFILEDWMKKEKFDFTILISALFLPFLFIMMDDSEYRFYYLLDWLLFNASLFIFIYRKKSVKLIYFQAIAVLLLTGCVINKEADLGVETVDLQKKKELTGLVEQTLSQDDSSYRMDFYANKTENFQNINRVFSIEQKISSVYSSAYNPVYKEFRENVVKVEKPNRNTLMLGVVENEIFRKIMGVKYIISNRQPVGYREALSGEHYNVYKNDEVAPLAYGTTKILSLKDYETLEFPYNQYVLAEYAVVDANQGTEDLNAVKEKFGSRVTKIESIKEIEGAPQGEYKLFFDAPKQDGILFIKFHVKNLKKNRDLKIDAGTARNKLSAKNYAYYNENTEFVYAEKVCAGQSSLSFQFYEGEYEISEAEAYLALLDTESSLYEYTWIEDKKQEKKTKDVLAGTVNMGEAGYFITSIPYDCFTVEVNGEEAEAVLVNKGFCGIALEKGENQIKIEYHAPGKRAGVCLAGIGFVLAVGIVLFDTRRTLSLKKRLHLGFICGRLS